MRMPRYNRSGKWIAVFCWSVTPFRSPVRNRLAKAFRQKCPEGRIIAISNMKIEKREFADALVYGLEGPETLINALLQQ